MEILGVNITELNKKEILDKFSTLSKGYICITSVHGLVEANEKPLIKNAFLNSYLNLPDGMPIVYFAKFVKKVQIERIPGYDFLEEFLNLANFTSATIATVGGDLNSILKFQQIINKKYSSIKFVGKNTEKILMEEPTDIIKIKNFLVENTPEYLLVFLSTPKQDWLMYEINKLNINVKIIGFGAALDYFIGDLKKAPKIISSLSLEWFYRLIQEPKRLYKRYFKIVPKFIYLILKNR